MNVTRNLNKSSGRMKRQRRML